MKQEMLRIADSYDALAERAALLISAKPKARGAISEPPAGAQKRMAAPSARMISQGVLVCINVSGHRA